MVRQEFWFARNIHSKCNRPMAMLILFLSLFAWQISYVMEWIEKTKK